MCFLKCKYKLAMRVLTCFLVFSFFLGTVNVFSNVSEKTVIASEDYSAEESNLSAVARSIDSEAPSNTQDGYFGYFTVFLMIVVSGALGMLILNFKRDGQEKTNKRQENK